MISKIMIFIVTNFICYFLSDNKIESLCFLFFTEIGFIIILLYELMH